MPLSSPASVSTINSAPTVESDSKRSTEVSSSPIGTALASSIGPVSSPASSSIVVTPVICSPFATAHWIGAAPSQPVTEQNLQAYRAIFGDDRWRFEAAGWCFIGLNSLIMNTGLSSEAEQFDWLAAELGHAGARPVALFLHKQLFLDSPDNPELVATSFRYVPMPARSRLVAMFGAVDLRLVASGHVHQRRDFTFGQSRQIWAPSAGFIVPDSRQEVIGIKEVGLVEYRFQPDSFEVRHVRAPGQIDIDLDSLLALVPKDY